MILHNLLAQSFRLAIWEDQKLPSYIHFNKILEVQRLGWCRYIFKTNSSSLFVCNHVHPQFKCKTRFKVVLFANLGISLVKITRQTSLRQISQFLRHMSQTSQELQMLSSKNAVPCHELRFSIVRLVIGVSNVTTNSSLSLFWWHPSEGAVFVWNEKVRVCWASGGELGESVHIFSSLWWNV